MSLKQQRKKGFSYFYNYQIQHWAAALFIFLGYQRASGNYPPLPEWAWFACSPEKLKAFILNVKRTYHYGRSLLSVLCVYFNRISARFLITYGPRGTVPLLVMRSSVANCLSVTQSQAIRKKFQKLVRSNIWMMLFCPGTKTNSGCKTAGRRLDGN